MFFLLPYKKLSILQLLYNFSNPVIIFEFKLQITDLITRLSAYFRGICHIPNLYYIQFQLFFLRSFQNLLPETKPSGQESSMRIIKTNSSNKSTSNRIYNNTRLQISSWHTSQDFPRFPLFILHKIVSRYTTNDS